MDLISDALHNGCSNKLVEARMISKHGRTAEVSRLKALQISKCSGTMEQVKVNISAPTFSGNYDSMDYYTFIKLYKVYILRLMTTTGTRRLYY